MDKSLQLRLSGDHEDQRQPDRAAFDLVDPLLRDLVVCAGAEAVDSVGRECEHRPAPQELRRALQPGLGGL